MDEKLCSRSQGQPEPGVRSAPMISIRRAISREGFIRWFRGGFPRQPYQSGFAAAITGQCRRFEVPTVVAARSFRNFKSKAALEYFHSHKRYYGIFLWTN